MRRAAIGLVLIACAPEPVVSAQHWTSEPIAPDPNLYDVVDACSFVCARLRYPEFRCPEAFANMSGATCTATCVQRSAYRNLPLSCWAHAESVAELRACGSIVCDQR